MSNMMKRADWVAAATLLCIVTIVKSDVNSSTGVQHCCKNKTDSLDIRNRRCSNGERIISLPCNSSFIVEEVAITPDGLTSEDTPGFVWSANFSEYCLSHLKKNRTGGEVDDVPMAIVCFSSISDSDEADYSFIQIYGILTLVSVVFLILTLAVYARLPELRDLQGKCIMCQCACLALAYLNLAVIQLGGVPFDIFEDCAVNSYMLYFWMMAMFFWLNVVSVNMYRSVENASYLKKTENRQFVVYSGYAWGAAVLFLAVSFIANSVEGPHLKPGFHKQCWFQGHNETWAYFYGPIACIIAINITLFVLAGLRLWNSATNNHEVERINILKYKLMLYLKLFVVTGVMWIFEVLSFAHGSSHVFWIITDICNSLQGLTYFVLLVMLRRRALSGLSERGFDCAPLRFLLSLFRHDHESENIVQDEPEQYGAEDHSEAPFTVNLTE